MSEDFGQACGAVVDWIKAYRRNIESMPVMPNCAFGDTLALLPVAAPEQSISFETILADFEKLIVPGLTHWQSPNFFGYFPANTSDPSMLAEMIVAAMGVQCMSWATSPAATELEIRMMEWLRGAFGLSDDFTGSTQNSASDSTMTAMLVARELKTDFTINKRGYQGTKLTAYCSVEAHSSIEKAAKIIGIGRDNLRKIAVDENLSMRTDVLLAEIEKDKKAGFTPFFVVGAFGTTGTTAVDDLSKIAEIAAKELLWFHVDAAYAGAALILPELRNLAKGIDKADSIVINAHKWLFTNFDCSLLYLKNTEALKQTFTLLPEYLRRDESDEVVNFRDWGPGLGRRFRSLKLWFVMRWFGLEGMREKLRGHLEYSALFESFVKDDQRFEIVAPRVFNAVFFRLVGENELSEKLLLKLNQSGKLFLSHTKIDGKYSIRMVIGQTNVCESHVRSAWELISKLGSEIVNA